MYEHVTRFIGDIDEGTISEGSFTHALYEPEITDKSYRETLDAYGLEGARPWSADVESLDLRASLALLTFVHRADHFIEGALHDAIESGFLRRILAHIDELDGGAPITGPIGFWRESDPLGCCSNWYPAGFSFADEEFATSEHWMMWQKARVMGDWDTAEKVLDAPTPRKAKELGAQVAPYDGALWDDVREELVYYGVREKFVQNPRLGNLLLSTKSALLAEASPYDRVWGIGLTADDPLFGDIASWRGSNLLGRVCMRVRSDLREASKAGIGFDALANGDWDNAEKLIRTRIGDMSLLELSRTPAARGAVLCYARIAQRQLMDEKIPDAEALLRSVGSSTVADIERSMRTNMGGGLTAVGWDELVCQLAFLHATGRL